MARKPSEYIELSGPLFDADMTERVNDAIASGIKELGEDAQEIMVGFISQAGFVRTGAFISSTESHFKRRGRSEVGFARVSPMDVWSGAGGKPTKTWLARGTREGVKLRKGNNVWAKTATRVNAMKVERIADKIAEALN